MILLSPRAQSRGLARKMIPAHVGKKWKFTIDTTVISTVVEKSILNKCRKASLLAYLIPCRGTEVEGVYSKIVILNEVKNLIPNTKLNFVPYSTVYS